MVSFITFVWSRHINSYLENPIQNKTTHDIFYHNLNISLQNIKPHNDNFSGIPSQKCICSILTIQRQILVQITHHKIVGQGNSGSSSFLLEKPKVRLVSLVIGLQWSQFSTFDWFSAHLARASHFGRKFDGSKIKYD